MPAAANPSRKPRQIVVDITDEDIAWAYKQNRFGCAIVRAIQRKIPDAVFVKADTEEIALSLRDQDTRYWWQTPPEVVEKIIKPFDQGQDITMRTFILEAAYGAEPMKHRTRAAAIEQRTISRRAPRPRSSSVPVHQLNRFLDYVADEGDK